MLALSMYLIRVLLPIIAFGIVYNCFRSMNKHIRPDKPLIMLINKTTEEQIPVLYWENSLGRSRNSDIIINDPTVSRDHAVLYRRKEGWIISDTNSKLGVCVNGEKIDGKRTVFINDVIKIGGTQLAVKKYSDVKEGKIEKFFANSSPIETISQAKLLFCVTFFHFLCTLQLLTHNGTFNIEQLVPFGIVEVSAWAYFFVSKYILRRVNFELEILAVFLSGIGIILIGGADIGQVYTQAACMIIGMFLFGFIVWFIGNPDRVMKWRIIIACGAVGLFALNLLIGKVQNGSRNWIVLGPVSVQPSELIKIAFIFVGASTLDRLQTAKNLTGFIGFSAICIGALFLMGDFGTACIFFVTFLVISFMRSGDIRTIILICSAAVLGLFMILKFKPYVVNRFMVWRHVWEYVNTLGYQQSRVLTYSASGGLFGMGIGNGRLKGVFASTSDLVFGMLCEEMGLLMAVIVAVVIAMLAKYSVKSGSQSRSSFYAMASCSAAALLIIQASLNIFGATDVLPLTGVTLPFVSLGGSSMISVWGLLAFIKASDERTYAARRSRR